MKANYSLLAKLILIGLLVTAGVVGSATAESNLSISKSGVITAPENITWTIKVTNYNETTFSVVNVTDDIPMNCSVVGNSTTNGTYKDGNWSFALGIGKNETLTLDMTCDVNLECSTPFKIENTVNITQPTDVLENNRTATANVTITGKDCLTITKEPKKEIYSAGENITWIVTVTNPLSKDVNNITVQEMFPSECTINSNQTLNGTFENKNWTFNLSKGAVAKLTLNMSCNTQVSCGKSVKIENTAKITAADAGKGEGDTIATANVTITGKACSPITVKPETLNLKKVGIKANGKGGVITVFITVGDVFNKTDILGDSFITCNEADKEKILFSEKDNGTIIAKFRRGDLNVTADNGTTKISCYGEINYTGGKLIIEGNDTVRVTHADDISANGSLLQRILQFLGIAPRTVDGEEDGTELDDSIPDTTGIPDDVKNLNLGQLKKLIGAKPTIGGNDADENNGDELDRTSTGNGKGKPKGVGIEVTPTPNENNGKGKGQGGPTDEKGNKGKD